MTPEQAEELRTKAERAVLAYSRVDWGGSHHSLERSHNAFKAAMRDLEAFSKKIKEPEKDVVVLDFVI